MTIKFNFPEGMFVEHCDTMADVSRHIGALDKFQRLRAQVTHKS